jgi:GNAT superfamily N-acetyltransferase
VHPERVGHISIRTAQLDDLPALRDIYRLASLANEGDRSNLLHHPEFLELSDRAVVERRMWLAEIDGEPVGFATTLPAESTVELEDLFVHPDWMRRGVGSRLVTDAVDRARREGFTRIEVTANPHALDFYRHLDFEELGPVETAFEPGIRMRLGVGIR